MPKTLKFKGADRPFAHMFFFHLTDTAPGLVDHFVDLCAKYLGGHPSQRHFSVGVRALEINRDVSATDFEISVHMVFDNIEAYRDYSLSPNHDKFITESAGMSPNRIVYDSYLRVLVERGAGDQVGKRGSPTKGPKG